jgi:hypothetical protein
MAFNNTVAARVAASVWGLKLGFTTMQSALAQANTSVGGLDTVINAAFNDSYSNTSNDAIADVFVNNLGLTGQAAIDGKAYVVAQLSAVAPTERGAELSSIASLFSSLTSDPTYGAFASDFNTRVAGAVSYSSTAGTFDAPLGFLPSAGSFFLSQGQDNITGTPGDDEFNAYIFDNSNSLQSADRIDGGNGTDTLFADMGASQAFAVTPITTSVEKILVRAQSEAIAQGQNNPGATGRVQIDAERINGASWFESNNSRSDVIVEDVRILPSQITKDITIAWVESDPGHVDYGVYFDQYSLRNQTSASSSIILQVMDTGATARGEAPLKDSNYGGFVFTVTPPGQASRVVTLQSQAIQDAQTYAELRAAFQAALDIEVGAGVATATLGANFTVVDPLSGSLVTGQSIALTTQSATSFTTPAGSGWLAQGTAPPASNFYTNFSTGEATLADLVTVQVVLDDVGRGSTGGDLVIGGLSTGVTSSSLGVQRFEVEVRDNSKLESMKSTNNSLREVVIVNGKTSNTGNAYIPTVTDAGTLTVNGNSGPNGANISNTLARDAQAGNNTPLPNSVPNSEYGLTDVRLIDGSAMTGKLAFTAEVTNASLVKYLNLRDIQALPADDNVHFMYTGGKVDDTMWVVLDSTAVASRNSIMSGREDFTFMLDGGTGNDNLTVRVSQLAGQSQAWYANQKLNANITVNGGEGNDTIRTPGAGDVKINGGAGADTIYADNTGAQAVTSGSANTAGAVYAAAEAAELARVLAIAQQANTTNSAAAAPARTPLAQPADTVAALDTLNLVTPVNFNDPLVPANPNPLLPTRAALQTAIDVAYTAGALTSDQVVALRGAYNTSTGTTVTIPTTITNPLGTNTISAGVPVAGALTSAEFAAGNSLLDTYIAAAEAALATATGADAALAAELLLLNPTQTALLNQTLVVNGVPGVQGGSINGTATILAGMTSLRAALVQGATDTSVVAAITTAVDNFSISNADGLNLYNAAISGGLGTVDANEFFAIQVILEPLYAAQTAVNTAANALLSTLTTANNDAAAAAAGVAGQDPAGGGANLVPPVAIPPQDSRGAADTAADATAAAAALTAFNTATVTPLTTQQTDLASLKAALAVGTSELQVTLITAAAVAKGTINAGDQAAINAAAGVPGAPVFGGTVDGLEKQNVDVIITALQQANDILVDAALQQRTVLQSVVTATAFASNQAAAAAAGASAIVDLPTTSRAIYVVNTANQQAVGPTGYVLSENDERNFLDLKSDANNSYNIFGSTVTVTFKGLTATANVPNTNYKTSDLQVNQSIKDAINNNPVLNKLLVANDGPGNTLVITSLIDGQMSLDNLTVELKLPLVSSLAAVDVAAAAKVWGLPTGSTAADVLAAMVATKATFDTKGDYVDQFAETGALAGNANIRGAASTTPSDNTINGGTGNDVIVLGTTADGTTPGDAMLSSNDTVVFSTGFGDDVIVHFKVGALANGGDVLNLSALGGSTLTTSFNVDKSVNVAPEVVATNGTAALVAGLYTDSATAQTHVYIAFDTTTNVGKVYSVVDAAGVGSGSVTATLAGTIDLADTLWADLTAVNFG